MAFNGSGTFNRIYNWVTDKANGFKITASRMDGEFDGIATGLSQCITKDGQTTITANIPLNNYKLTGAGNGTARTDVINVGQVQDNQFQYLGTTGGTADAYTLTPSPTITAYATTQQITAKISATNLTTTPYLQVSAIANPTTTAVIKKLSATKTEIAVEASDLLINGIYHFQRNSANDAWIVLNPEKDYFNLINATKATTTTQGVSYLNNPITIANNATDANNDIDFSAGTFQFSDGSGQALATAIMTKRLDATWSAGTGNGGLFNGTAVPKAVNSTYHCYKIYNSTTNTEDSGFLLGISGTAPNPTSVLPSGYTKFKRVGSILTDGSGNIRAFTQFGNYFKYATGISDLNGSFVAGSTTPQVSTPLGINALGIFNIGLDISSVSTGNNIWSVISDFNQTSNLGIVSHRQSSVTVTKIPSFINIASGSAFAFTNLSSQIRISNNEGVPATTLAGISLLTQGFIDINLNL
jgi:hypothetical protein